MVIRARWRPYLSPTPCPAVDSRHTSTVGSNSCQEPPAASLRPSSRPAARNAVRGKHRVLYGTRRERHWRGSCNTPPYRDRSRVLLLPFFWKICALPPPNQRRKLPCRAGIRFWFRQLSDPWRDRFAHGRRDFGGWEANGIGTCCDASTGELARWLGARHSRSRVFRRRVVERPTYWRQSQLVGRGRLAVPKCASTELATEQLKVVCGRAFAAPSSQCQPGPGPFQHRLALSLPTPARPAPSPC